MGATQKSLVPCEWIAAPGYVFDLTFERGSPVLRTPNREIVRRTFVSGYGSTKTQVASPDPKRRASLEWESLAMHDEFRAAITMIMQRN